MDNHIATLAKRLRESTERMAHEAMVPPLLWNEHSNLCLEAASALDAHDRQSRVPGDAAVARLAEIARASEPYCDGLHPVSGFAARIHDIATRPLATTPNPPPDTVPFTREMRELLGAGAFCLALLLLENGRNVDAEDIQRCACAAFPSNPKDNRDAP